jgi:hypothetical protein
MLGGPVSRRSVNALFPLTERDVEPERPGFIS